MDEKKLFPIRQAAKKVFFSYLKYGTIILSMSLEREKWLPII